MNKNELSDMKKLSIDLAERSDDNSFSEKVNELKNDGHSQIKLKLKISPEKLTEDLLLDVDLFTKIKTIQDLPDWVIIKLILVKGTLKRSNFQEQLHIG